MMLFKVILSRSPIYYEVGAETQEDFRKLTNVSAGLMCLLELI